MRLKTLRKERPAFENEGTVVSGSRMDLSNNEYKPSKRRTNNGFALPASLTYEISSMTISISDRMQGIDTHPTHQASINGILKQPAPSQATRTSSYQALEAAYLEHGIRIHLNPVTAATVAQQQNQNLTAENLSERKSENSNQRYKAFVHRNPSRSSSALHYPTVLQDAYQDSRPFSALQQTSTNDFEETHPHNASYTETTASQQKLQIPEELNNNYCSSSILVSEHSDPMTLQTQAATTTDAKSTTAVPDADPDIAYMSSLLQTTSGDSYRDTIRRRAGLRPTLAVHRHPQPTRTSTNSKQQEKSSVIHSSTTNHRNSSLRHSTITAAPTTLPKPSHKKVEKDILKHASRIRTSQLKDYFLHHDSSLKVHPNQHISSMSTSPTRTNHVNKRNKTNKSSKSISLEPLELLLAHTPRSISPRTPSHVNLLSLNEFPAINHNSHRENVKCSRKFTKSPKTPFIESNNTTRDEITTDLSLSEHSNSSSLNYDSLRLMKNSPLGMISNNKTHQSNSIDSGCYDRCSSSGDTQSIASVSINQKSNSVPSTRITSASTRRSNLTKKVSFEDQSRAIIVTTAIYV